MTPAPEDDELSAELTRQIGDTTPANWASLNDLQKRDRSRFLLFFEKLRPCPEHYASANERDDRRRRIDIASHADRLISSTGPTSPTATSRSFECCASQEGNEHAGKPGAGGANRRCDGDVAERR